tara:strand:- start:410 stop:691 length:282 start_codon:yes stop_codon:yes gene_type:complete
MNLKDNKEKIDYFFNNHTSEQLGEKLMKYDTNLSMTTFPLHDDNCSFTFEEVEVLLKTQRGNCCVAAMEYIVDDEILSKINNAPMWDYRKTKI